MRFALLGNHPDGLAMAKALSATGRFTLAAYSGPRPALDICRSFAPDLKPSGDIEEVLADPAIQMVIVAGLPGNRSEPLRRALQSERIVLCVHPADDQPDAAYEAGMLQEDNKQVLLPLLAEAFHPGIARLVEVLRSPSIGGLRLIELAITARNEALIDADLPGHEPSFPGWPLLRRLGGEVAEVSAFAQSEELLPGEPVLVSGRFRSGGLFQVQLLPFQDADRWSIRVIGTRGHALLTLEPTGQARLTWHEEVPDPAGDTAIATKEGTDARPRVHLPREETWPSFDPWPALVEIFEDALEKKKAILTWQDEVRCLELDDAARRSLERRRASSMEYQEANEEVGFKGTMTLVGCALLWSILVVLFLSIWFPRLGWLIAPVLAIFLGLQLLRWIIPREPKPPANPE